jgi:hypothetical protein
MFGFHIIEENNPQSPVNPVKTDLLRFSAALREKMIFGVS